MKLSEPLDSKVYLTVQPRSPATGIRNSEYRTCTQINIFNDHESVQVVDIDLKEVSAQVTTHDMANHSIFSTQALPNSFVSSLLLSEIRDTEQAMKQYGFKDVRQFLRDNDFRESQTTRRVSDIIVSDYQQSFRLQGCGDPGDEGGGHPREEQLRATASISWRTCEPPVPV